MKKRLLNNDDRWLLGILVRRSIGGARDVAPAALNLATQNERFGPDSRLREGVGESLTQLELHGFATRSSEGWTATDEGVTMLAQRRSRPRLRREIVDGALYTSTAAGLGRLGAIMMDEGPAGQVGTAVVAGGVMAAVGVNRGYRLRTTGRQPALIDDLDHDALTAGRALLDMRAKGMPSTRAVLRFYAPALTGSVKQWAESRVENALIRLVEADVIRVAAADDGELEIRFTEKGLRQAGARYPGIPAPQVHTKKQLTNPDGLLSWLDVSIGSMKTPSPGALAALYVASEIQHETESDVSYKQIADQLVAQQHKLYPFTRFRPGHDLAGQISSATEELGELGLATISDTSTVTITPRGFKSAEDLQEAREALEERPSLRSLA